MSLATLFLLIIGLSVSILLGVAFSTMEFATIALNRIRLLRLFADEHPEPTCEREIFRGAKGMYFISRFGSCAAFIGSGLCVFAIARQVAGAGLSTVQAESTVVRWICGIVAILIVTPLYLLLAQAMPRLLFRPLVVDSEAALPAWVRGLCRFSESFTVPLRQMSVPSLGRFLPQRQLTKSDLVALITDLNVEEEKALEPGRVEDSAEKSSGEMADEEEPDEEEIIYNILDLEETYVREIMKPINSVIAIRLSDLSFEGVKALARSSGYTRFPVYRERIINLFGFISAYDVLQGNGSEDIESCIKPAYFVPEFMRVSALLKEFLERRTQVAVVVDEYGGCSGWITREDIFEEIVGVFDPDSRLLEQCDDGTYLTDGGANISDLAEILPIHFEEPQYDTLAGFLLDKLGIIPATDDQVVTDEAVYTVEKMEGNRIAKVRIALGLSEEQPQDHVTSGNDGPPAP